jgi:hypothetical protein
VAKQNMQRRRTIITSLGAMAAAGALQARPAEAQSAPSESFTPTLHAQDEWMSAMKGQHRIVLDVTSPTGVPDAIRFAGNLLTGHKNGWGVEESDVAMIVCFRHGATPFGYTNAVWSKYGKTIDPKTTPALRPIRTTRENQRSSPLSRNAACSSWCAGPRAGDWRAALPEQAATSRRCSRRWART